MNTHTPVEISDYITVDPRVCHGKPCFKGTRIMVYIVLELLAAGERPEDIVEHTYPQLTTKHIEAALQFAAKTAQTGETFVEFSE